VPRDTPPERRRRAADFDFEVPLSRKRLRGLRWITIAVELVLILLTDRLLGTKVDIYPAILICGAQALLNLVGLRWPAPEQRFGAVELLLQLSVDVAALTGVAYFAGGSANPLITLYLPLVAVGATVLPAVHAASLAFASVACYTFVSLVHRDLPIHDHDHAFQVHLVGMWLVFVCSTATIAWFLVRMSQAIRRRDAALAAAREAALRDERVVMLGNLAAGAAHELGRPLSTLAIVAGELAQRDHLAADIRSDAELIRDQIQECKRIITQLVDRAGSPRSEAASGASIEDWIARLIDRWRERRPAITPTVDLHGPRPAPRIFVDATLDHALLNLFDNAADASPDLVAIDVHWESNVLAIDILDRGPGIAAEIATRVGLEPVTTRGAGRGIGAVLARSAVERLGGGLSFDGRPGGGAAVRVRLPLARLVLA